jgi:hypothetical protein
LKLKDAPTPSYGDNRPPVRMFREAKVLRLRYRRAATRESGAPTLAAPHNCSVRYPGEQDGAAFQTFPRERVRMRIVAARSRAR